MSWQATPALGVDIRHWGIRKICDVNTLSKCAFATVLEKRRRRFRRWAFWSMVPYFHTPKILTVSISYTDSKVHGANMGPPGSWRPHVGLMNLAIWELCSSVKQLHFEFLRAGADVIQCFTFLSNEGRLQSTPWTKGYTVRPRTRFNIA